MEEAAGQTSYQEIQELTGKFVKPFHGILFYLYTYFSCMTMAE
jgi:hypothetical protein